VLPLPNYFGLLLSLLQSGNASQLKGEVMDVILFVIFILVIINFALSPS